MQKNHIDIIILIDTKAESDTAKHFSNQKREMLGQGCYVASHPVEPAAALNTQKTKRVGGQMILSQPTWGGAIIKSSADRSGLGILTATTIRAVNTDILLLGNYWPIPHEAEEHSQSLTAHLHHYIKKKEKNHKGSPLDWIKASSKSSNQNIRPQNQTHASRQETSMRDGI